MRRSRDPRELVGTTCPPRKKTLRRLTPNDVRQTTRLGTIACVTFRFIIEADTLGSNVYLAEGRSSRIRFPPRPVLSGNLTLLDPHVGGVGYVPTRPDLRRLPSPNQSCASLLPATVVTGTQGCLGLNRVLC